MSSSTESGDSAKKVAADATARAKAAGAVGGAHRGALDHAQRQLRDFAIVAAVHAGEPTREIAKTFELTPRGVAKVVEAFGKRRTALEQRPMEIVERLSRVYESQIARFAAMALANVERMPAVAIAALKAEADATERYANLLADVGKLPDNLENFRSESEMLRVGQRMRETMLKLGSGEVTVGEAVEVFDALMLTPRMPFDVDGEARELPPAA